jgi:hypothetical protein
VVLVEVPDLDLGLAFASGGFVYGVLGGFTLRPIPAGEDEARDFEASAIRAVSSSFLLRW